MLINQEFFDNAMVTAERKHGRRPSKYTAEPLLQRALEYLEVAGKFSKQIVFRTLNSYNMHGDERSLYASFLSSYFGQFSKAKTKDAGAAARNLYHAKRGGCD